MEEQMDNVNTSQPPPSWEPHVNLEYIPSEWSLEDAVFTYK